MTNKLVSLTSAEKIDAEGELGIEIIINPLHITHFHKAEQRKGSFTHIHFVSGHVALVTQTVEEVKELLQPELQRGSRTSMGTA